ncbi:MAG: hypothetical protein JKX79_11760 [Labilibaculum sp.]|nr:hypothetical protein [Labilibaculum sp.]
MKKIKSFVFLSLTILLFNGCASILSTSSYPVSIVTDPDDAKITITNKKGHNVFNGKSPANIILDTRAGFFSKESYSVNIQKEGYQPVITSIECKLDGWYWGNILIGGLVGMLIVDPLSGAMWKFDSPNISRTLNKNSNDNVSPEFKIMTYNSIPSEWKNSLVRIK